MRLAPHALEQRKSRLVAKLTRLGEVTIDDTGSRAGTRIVRVSALAPGGGLPALASFEYREAFRGGAARGPWEVVGYAYEYRQLSGPGRRAYHLHGEGFHAHCLDPREPRRGHHYRASEIDLFEAHDEFRRLYLRGDPVSCDDLRPALDAARDR